MPGEQRQTVAVVAGHIQPVRVVIAEVQLNDELPRLLRLSLPPNVEVGLWDVADLPSPHASIAMRIAACVCFFGGWSLVWMALHARDQAMGTPAAV